MSPAVAPQPPTRGTDRRLSRAFLRVAGCRTPDEVLAAIDEGAEEVRRRRAWKAWQLLLVCAYELRDRIGRAARRGVPAGGLRPLLAARLAVRGVVHRPGIPATAALTLAVGFGAAAAIFSVYVGFGRPLPVPDGERVVQVRINRVSGETEQVAADVRADWAAARSLTGLGAYRTVSRVLDVPGSGPVRVPAAALTPEAFRVLGVAPALGRLPTAADVDGLLLDDSLWRGSFAADPGIVGREVQVDSRPRVVLGVMPSSFGFPFSQHMWTVLPESDPDPAAVVGRLAPGVTNDAAAAELQGMLRDRRRDEPEAVRVRVLGFTESRGEGGEVVALVALLMLVIALLLVSSTNVANLLLVRAGARARMLAVHVAIGAQPGQVALQLLAEAVLIALVGAVLGLGFATLAVDYIEGTLSGHWGYHWMEVSVQGSVLLFTLALAALTAIACGVVPAVRLARANLTEPLKGDHTGVLSGGRPSPWLVGTQVAFSSGAVVVAALLLTGLLGSRTVDAGFPADEVHVASVQLEGQRYESGEARDDFQSRLLAAARRRPGIRAVAVSTGLAGLNTGIGRVEVESAPVPTGTRPPAVPVLAISDGYLELMNLRLLAGRGLRPEDGSGEDLVALVSQSFVRRHLEGGEPLEQRIRLAGGPVADRWARIVGVVSDVVIYPEHGEEHRDWVYLPIGQAEPAAFYVLYRTGADAAAALTGLRATLRELDPSLPLDAVLGGAPGSPITDVLRFVRRLFVTVGVLATLGGTAALLVAMIGLYGLLAFEVESRRAEIGVRMALGADRGRVIGEVVRRGLRGLAPGLALGVVVTWATAPLFGVFLMGAEPRNPAVFALTVAAYLLVGTLAAALPARRAAATDPAASLRAS